MKKKWKQKEEEDNFGKKIEKKNMWEKLKLNSQPAYMKKIKSTKTILKKKKKKKVHEKKKKSHVVNIVVIHNVLKKKTTELNFQSVQY